MERCETCGAPTALAASGCPFDVPEEIAPWRGDYAAMARGEMTHAEHKVQVARWALHHASTQSQKSLAMLRVVAQDHSGQMIKIFDPVQ